MADQKKILKGVCKEKLGRIILKPKQKEAIESLINENHLVRFCCVSKRYRKKKNTVKLIDKQNAGKWKPQQKTCNLYFIWKVVQLKAL